MKNAIDVFLGDPLDLPSEQEFLKRLRTDLSQRNTRALILANFHAGRNLREIDFLIVTRTIVCHVELKNWQGELIGGVDGPWSTRTKDGSLAPLERANPYGQTLECKYAISDSMRDFWGLHPEVPAPRGQYYRQMESVLCIYPSLHPESQVPRSGHVRTLGYKEMLDLVARGECSPAWTFEHWVRFAMDRHLVREDPSEVVESEHEAELALRDYRSRLREETCSKPRLVPLRLREGHQCISTKEIARCLGADQSLLIVGPSGFGKTLLSYHLAAGSPETVTPVVVNTRLYEGRLGNLLDRSVAPYHPRSFVHLGACTKFLRRRLALILDDLGGCPTASLPDLLGEVRAIQIRFGAQVILTSKESLPLPESLKGRVLEFADLSGDERCEILTQCLNRVPTTDEQTIYASLDSPLQLSIAAHLNPTGILTRSELLDSYVSRCCDSTRAPALSRTVIRTVSALMLKNMRASISLGEYALVAEPILGRGGPSGPSLDEVLRCDLLEHRSGRIQFQHEQFEHFLQAEALVLDSPNPERLAGSLTNPTHRHLAELALGILLDRASIAAGLEAVASPNTYAAALRGELGRTARRVATDAARIAFRLAEEDLCNVRLTIDQDDPKSTPLVVFGGQRHWSRAERALLQAIGTVVHEGLFVDDVFRLIGQVEAHELSLAHQNKNPKHRTVTSNLLFQATYSLSSPNQLPIRDVIQGIEASRYSRPPCKLIGDALVAGSRDLAEKTAGHLYFYCELARHLDNAPATVLVEILNASWATRIYHLRLAALEMIEGFAHHKDESFRAELVQALRSIDTEGIHVFESSVLVEALDRFGAIECPRSSVDAVSEARTILAQTNYEDGNPAAYSWIGMIFEEVFGPTYGEALRALSLEEQVKLITAAAIGAPSYGGYIDWCLIELLQRNNPLALPAFLHWSTRINVESMSTHEPGIAFLLGNVGAARLLSEPPTTPETESADEHAWYNWGKIVFWTHRPGLGRADLEKRCGPLWSSLAQEYRCAALDPLTRLHWPLLLRESNDPIQRVIEAWRSEIRALLEFGVRNLHNLTSLFPNDQWHRPSRDKKIIELLGEIGSRESVETLQSLTHHQDLGVCAVEAIKRIHGRLDGG